MKETLEGFPDVLEVLFAAAQEQFEVAYRAAVPRGEDFKDAVSDVVVFPGVRKFLGGIGDNLNNSKDTGP